MTNENEKALDALIEDAMTQEKALAVREENLALQNKQFADYLQEKKHADEKLEVLWDMVKEYMEENNISVHETPYIKLTLTPSGKFRPVAGTTADDLPDEICDVKRTLSNKKVKAYQEINGTLPAGVESSGNLLRKKVL